jgi:hypothetical protein
MNTVPRPLHAAELQALRAQLRPAAEPATAAPAPAVTPAPASPAAGDRELPQS